MPTSQLPSASSHPLRRGVTVAQVGDHYQVRSLVAFRAGEAILEIAGMVTDRPSRYSVQIEDHAHIEVPIGQDLATTIERSPWRFLNHSCAPNAVVQGRTLIALTAIAAGQEVTFDYNTTEYEMATPFSCHCGAPACLGSIRGFRFLTKAQRQQRRAWLSPHLLRRLGEELTHPQERRDE